MASIVTMQRTHIVISQGGGEQAARGAARHLWRRRPKMGRERAEDEGDDAGPSPAQGHG